MARLQSFVNNSDNGLHMSLRLIYDPGPRLSSLLDPQKIILPLLLYPIPNLVRTFSRVHTSEILGPTSSSSFIRLFPLSGTSIFALPGPKFRGETSNIECQANRNTGKVLLKG